MKKAFSVAISVLALTIVPGCIIVDDGEDPPDDGTVTCPPGSFLHDGVCYTHGSTCDFYNDQDCVNRTQAWWCSPDGRIFINDCIQQCTPYGMPYACCGYDPTRGDDACLCCAEPDCSGFQCHP